MKQKPTENLFCHNERQRIIKLENKGNETNMFHAQNVSNETNNISIYVEYR